MRILVLSSKYPPEYAGSGLRAHNTYKRLKKKFAIDYDVIAGSEEFNNNVKYLFDGVTVVRLGKISSTTIHGNSLCGRIVRSLLRCFDYLRIGYLTLQRLRKTKYDLFHTFGDSVSIHVAMYYAKVKKIPLLREMCNLDTPVFPVLPFRLHRLFPRVLKQDFQSVSISKRISEICLGNGIPRDSIWERPNPIDEAKFYYHRLNNYSLRRKYCEFSEKDTVILNISKFRPSKNQIFLLDVLLQLDKRYKLLLCGPRVKGGPKQKRDDAYFNDIVKKIDMLGLSDRVQIKEGFINNVEDYYRLCDIFAFPSLVEACGTPILESIACGVPVVANLVKGVTDSWIKNGVNGFAIPLRAGLFAEKVKMAAKIDEIILKRESSLILKLASTEVIDSAYRQLFFRLRKISYETGIFSGIANK